MSGPAKPLTSNQADAMASKAWDAYAALQRTQMREPVLGTNPYWQALKDAAYARMMAIMDSGAMK